MEQQLAARLGEWQIAEFIKDDQIDAAELFGQSSGAAFTGFGLVGAGA